MTGIMLLLIESNLTRLASIDIHEMPSFEYELCFLTKSISNH